MYMYMYHRTLLLFPSDEVLPSLGVYQRVMRLLRDELFGVCVCVCARARAQSLCIYMLL